MVIDNHQAEIRICIQVELRCKVWVGPDHGDPANWAGQKPVYSQQVSLARVVDQEFHGKNALLAAEHVADMSTHCAGFIVSNLAGKL